MYSLAPGGRRPPATCAPVSESSCVVSLSLSLVSRFSGDSRASPLFLRLPSSPWPFAGRFLHAVAASFIACYRYTRIHVAIPRRRRIGFQFRSANEPMSRVRQSPPFDIRHVRVARVLFISLLLLRDCMYIKSAWLLEIFPMMPGPAETCPRAIGDTKIALVEKDFNVSLCGSDFRFVLCASFRWYPRARFRGLRRL